MSGKLHCTINLNILISFTSSCASPEKYSYYPFYIDAEVSHYNHKGKNQMIKKLSSKSASDG